MRINPLKDTVIEMKPERFYIWILLALLSIPQLGCQLRWANKDSDPMSRGCVIGDGEVQYFPPTPSRKREEIRGIEMNSKAKIP
jgi:hypothetical protein